ncbi:hypothetical protein DASC09_038690 [Saccharomycopsis crataegensis]|uniref:D-arabinitol 2-dehydrogenase [ribulose-forming] n=1 Tax=Saccharomycopsis crataegensis TaxID=43959 RepID=A0AAV5QPE9_9ASCO|nr:hypothetical protein DASC09_038690 [Saccharomycopsis crataegensis]
MTNNNVKVADIVPNFRVDGRLAIITGCGSPGNLAYASAQGLLAQGASVALSDINYEGVQKAAAALADFATQNDIPLTATSISSWKIDVSDANEISTTFKKINEHHGQVADLLLNCAGFCYNIAALDFPPEKAQKLINCNLMGSLFTAQSFAQNLVANKMTGSVIMIASMSGLIVNEPQPQCVYNMSKAGVIHLAKSLGAEWATLGIRVNAISPAYIDTPINAELIKDVALLKHWEDRTPMNRLAQPEEFIGTVLYLAQNKASSYTTGANIVVDGGFTCW